MEVLYYPGYEREAFMARYAPEATDEERVIIRAREKWSDAVIDNAIQQGY